jgi:aminopeptidase
VSAEFAARLQRYADVIVRVGLNMRAGQRLLIGEPFELQGVAREAAPLVDAVSTAARTAGAVAIDVIWGDENRWRAAAQRGGDREFERLLECNGERMRQHARRGDALLFLQSSHASLMAGIPARHVARLREAGWRAYGRVAPDLIAGRTNWSAAAAPTGSWAQSVFRDRPAGAATCELWERVFAACRVDEPDPVQTWREHLAALDQQRDALNDRRVGRVRFVGPGTDLTVELAPAHVWCTAVLRCPDGLPFVANLPTEEIFTAPHRDGVNGVVRIARPVPYGGGAIVDAELEFRGGEVVRARAGAGGELLDLLLATDAGASRLGEVALVPRPLAALTRDGVCFQLPLFDENALPHIALGETYPFSVSRAGAAVVNHSLVHVDLPIEASVELVHVDRH